MIRTHRSDNYNWNFDTDTGLFMRWGNSVNDDPQCSSVGPEILDMEISTTCHGPGIPCKFCYKSNGPDGKYMSLEKFSEILCKLPENLTQIAFGIGDIDSNPDLFRIMSHCREKGIIPNLTINGYRMSDELYNALSELCGAVAVSNYGKSVCYGAVKKLTDLGMKQVNIHQILSEESFDTCMDLLDDINSDPRLEKLNAVVFLMLKPKGGAKDSTLISKEKFNLLIEKAFRLNSPIGFDSCSAPAFLNSIEAHPKREQLEALVEPCEAFLFSSYCNVDGEFFPCSFCEDEQEWEIGLPLTESTNFMEDVWNHERMEQWRNKLIGKCRACPMFDLYV